MTILRHHETEENVYIFDIEPQYVTTLFNNLRWYPSAIETMRRLYFIEEFEIPMRPVMHGYIKTPIHPKHWWNDGNYEGGSFFANYRRLGTVTIPAPGQPNPQFTYTK